MVRFLNTYGINDKISEIMRTADEFVFIVSPYLKLSERIRIELEDMQRLKIDMRIVYGKKELRKEEMDWLESTNWIRVGFIKNLHAKCYVNEKMAVISSMNLYDFSQTENYEMGIVAYRDEDPELYGDIINEVRKLLRISEDISLATPSKEEKASYDNPPKESPVASMDKSFSNHNGWCIRCGSSIVMNPDNPYCDKCFKSWNRWKNPDYIEEKGHCHSCGKDNRSSMSNPLCSRCKPGLGNTLRKIFG